MHATTSATSVITSEATVCALTSWLSDMYRATAIDISAMYGVSKLHHGHRSEVRGLNCSPGIGRSCWSLDLPG